MFLFRLSHDVTSAGTHVYDPKNINSGDLRQASAAEKKIFIEWFAVA
jgi:hypothetical protein